MKHILIIGYGNQSRSDDGVGWYVVDKIEKNLPDNVEVLKLNQLTVELAENIKDRAFVIFVDAHVNDTDNMIKEEEIKPLFKPGLITHYLTPETLLAICEGLYDKVPRAHLFSVRGVNFDFGEKLSERTKEAANDVIERIIEVVKGRS